ncbi:MAG: AAA family ATPase [Bacteroidales bacterium]|nr:AAA family ATPase [Bacteroidales bacterium]
MIDKETLRKVLVGNQRAVEQYAVLSRDIPSDDYERIVLVGARRAGKSFMLYQKMQDLMKRGHGWDEMLYLNFEEDRLMGFSIEDFEKILECHAEMYGKRPKLFLDEIQNVAGWERFARRMADMKYFIWITGSNQQMLSKDIQARLGGRYSVKEVYPYSLYEYLKANGIEYDHTASYGMEYKADLMQKWNEYLEWGGMPEIADISSDKPRKRDYLRDTFGKIYLGDIKGRLGISSPNEIHLRILLKKMAESVNQPQTYTNFMHILSSIGGKVTLPTITKYVEGCEDAWLILRLRNYSSRFSEKETSCKYYFIDNGFLNLQIDDRKGALLENAVALSLFRKYGREDQLYFYRDNIEVDFYVPDDNLAIQVSYSIHGSIDTFNREKDALTKFANYKQGCKRLIVTNDDNEIITDEFGEIEVIPFWKWNLLNDLQKARKIELIPLLRQYMDFKKAMPNLVPLFHVSGSYETYQADAELVAKVLKIPVLESATHIGPDGNPARYVAISEHDLEGCRKILLDNKVGMALLEDSNLEKDDVKDDSLKSSEPLSHERNDSLDLGKDGSHGRHR